MSTAAQNITISVGDEVFSMEELLPSIRATLKGFLFRSEALDAKEASYAGTLFDFYEACVKEQAKMQYQPRPLPE